MTDTRKTMSKLSNTFLDLTLDESLEGDVAVHARPYNLDNSDRSAARALERQSVDVELQKLTEELGLGGRLILD